MKRKNESEVGKDEMEMAMARGDEAEVSPFGGESEAKAERRGVRCLLSLILFLITSNFSFPPLFFIFILLLSF